MKEVSFGQPIEEVSPEILVLQGKDVNFEEPDYKYKCFEYQGKYSKEKDCFLGGLPPILKGQKVNYSDKIILRTSY